MDFNRNGVPNECEAEEPYIDPLPLDIRFLFLSDTSTKQPPFPMDDFPLTYLNVPAGRYVRVILLTGTPQFMTWVSGRVPEGIRPSDCPLNFSLTGSGYTSVKTQWDEEPSYTWSVPWRGINQHYYDGLTARAIPDGEGILDAGWPDVADPNPVPVTSIKP